MEGVFSACSSGNIALVKGLIDGGVSPLVRDDQQNTLLHVCCASDPCRLDLLQYLLFLIEPSNVSQLRNANGSIPLHLACTNGNNNVVQFLVPRYCDFSDFLIPDNEHKTSLYIACENGYTDIVSYACTGIDHCIDDISQYLAISANWSITLSLLKNITLDDYIALVNTVKCAILSQAAPTNNFCIQLNYTNTTFLHLVAISGDIDLLQYLVNDMSWDVNCFDENSYTPVHLAISKSCVSTAKFLISVPHCKCETMNIFGQYPIHDAVRENQLEIVTALVVNRKCDVNVRTIHGYTPLHCACENGSFEIFSLLATHPQCEEAENDDMKRPLHIACQSGNVAIVHHLVVQMQCDINVFDKSRNTPLHYACGAFNERRSDLVCSRSKNTSNIEIVKLLSNHPQCETLEAENSDMERPLHLACQSGNVAIVYHLVNKNCQINIKDKCGNTPLHYACECRSFEIFSLLATHPQCETLEADNNDKGRPLHIACQSGNAAIVRHLVNKNCQINIKDKCGNTPLHYACQYGSFEIFSLLATHPQCETLEAENDDMERPLHIACQSGSIAIVQHLVVQMQCDINILDKSRNTPLHYACGAFNERRDLVFKNTSNIEIVKLISNHFQCKTLEAENNDMERPLHIACQSRNVAIVHHLVDKNCQINIKGKHGNTPLHYACESGSFDIFSLLATHPQCETLETENDDMERPLHIACQSGSIAIVQHLIDKNCQINTKGKHGYTPVHYACKNGRFEIFSLLAIHSQCETLEAENDDMERPLHLACQSGNVAIVQHLVIQMQCEINAFNKSRNTPLHYACRKRWYLVFDGRLTDTDNIEIVKLLSNHSQCKTLEAENNDMERPLHIACQSRNVAVVRHLIDKNCQINIKGKHGNTPLHYACACQERNFEIFSLLATHPQCETLEAENNDMERPLHVACQSGNVAIVQHLVVQMQCDVNVFDKSRNTPLHYACGAFNVRRSDLIFKNTGNIEIVKLLSNHPQCETLEAENNDMERPLHIACQTRNVAVVHHLVNKNCEINVKGKHGNTPLHYACESGSLEIFSLLTTHPQCETLEAENDDMERPLHIACQSRNVAVVHHLIDKNCQINIKGKHGNTPLHYACACQKRNFEIFSLLATHPQCETLEAENDDMERPLHIACQSGNVAIVQHLVVQMQCDINIFDKSRNTPLHYSCGAFNKRRDLDFKNTSNIEIVKLLSNHPQCETLEAENNDMERPLHIACQSRNVAIVHHLLNKNCEINIDGKHRNTPLHYACESGSFEIFSLLTTHSQCETLEAENDDMERPLHIACQSRNVAIVQRLVQMQCDINIFDKSRNTPLHYACGAFNERRSDLVCSRSKNTSNIEIVKLLTNHSQCETLEAENDDMERPLHIACQSTNVAVVRHLVNKNCQINIKGKHGNTPLHYACQNGSFEIFSLLGTHPQHETIEAENDDMKRPLHIACQSGNLAIVHHLVVQMQCDINIFDKSRNTPLHYACEAWRDLVFKNTGNIEIVKLLSNHPQCKILEAENDDMKRPLHIACQSGNVAIVHHLIVQMQCDINIFDKNRNTPLHYACGVVNKRRDLVFKNTGNIEIVKLLSNHSQCKVLEAENDHMERPLHIACQSRNVAVVRHLVDTNCQINIKGKHGNTPLHYACQESNFEIFSLLATHPQCETLEVENDDMERPLHIACQSGNIDIVRHFIDKKCQINVKGKHGNTLLHYACQIGGNFEIFSLLATHPQCETLEAENDDMERPLHIACQSANVAIVQHLIDKNCEINIKGKSQNTPLHYACQQSNFEIFSLLATHSHCETLEAENDDMERPLHIACQSGNVKIIRHLVINKRCNIYAKNWNGDDPLQCAIDHANFSAVNFLCKYFPKRSLEKCNFLPYFSKLNSFFETVSSNGMVKLKIVKCILTGPPGSGKSTLKKKLLNESLTEASLSTGVVDAAVQIPVYRKLQQHNAVIPTTGEDNAEWKNQDLEEETFLLNTCLQRIRPSHVLRQKVMRNINNVIHGKPYYSEASFRELEKNCYSVNFENKTNDGTVDNNDISSRAKGTVSLFKLASSASNVKRMQYTQNFEDSGVMLHIIDTGGQPEFHEMLPALVTGPAINLLVFKLNEDLRSSCNITYRSGHGNSLPYPTSLTHEEVILRTLASIACLRQNALGWSESVDKDESEPAAFLIATHRDCVQESDVAEVNERLKQLIKSSSHLFEETLIQFATQEQVIFPVDTVNDVTEIKELRCRLEEVASKNFSELLIPASWCAFSVRLRRRQESFHQLSYCYRVAKECGIKDTAEFLSVLWYLHHRVGHIMYYPEVEGLKDVVITNLQLIFDCTTELVTSCFTFKQFKHPSVYERFAKNGKFLESDLEKVSLKQSGAPFSSKTFVLLLKHLYIVAGPFASDNGNCYFMPCALKPAAVNDLVRDESSIGPVPLLIYFECGYTPVGVFCCLVIYLLSQTSDQWILINKPQNRNKITFKIHKTHDKVTLISRATYLEVWVDRIPGLISPVSDDSLCGQVLSTIQSGILTVVQSLNYTYKSKHNFGFHCSCCSSSSPHPALVDELGVAAVCVFNNDDVMPLNGGHMMWSKKVCNQYFMLMIFICLLR